MAVKFGDDCCREGFCFELVRDELDLKIRVHLTFFGDSESVTVTEHLRQRFRWRRHLPVPLVLDLSREKGQLYSLNWLQITIDVPRPS